MSDDILYNEKPLSSLDLWALGLLEKHLEEAENNRNKIKSHPKFQSMKLPEANPEFIKLKNAVKEEIRKKQNV